MKESPTGAPVLSFLANLARRPAFAYFLLLTAVFFAYFPALSGDFLWDDIFLVGKNPLFRSPVYLLEVFRHWLFVDSFSNYYRPVQNWSYILDYWIWNQNSFGYHLSNILLHATAAWLLLLLLRRLISSVWAALPKMQADAAALLVALLWAVHPIHNAAVAYISGRADTLAMIFVLAAWLLTWRALGKPGSGRPPLFLLAWLCALLGILSKEIAIVWFGFILLTTVAFLRQLTRAQKAAVIGGLLTVIGAYLCLRFSLPQRAAPPDAHHPLSLRAFMALRALGDYGTLIFWPGNLHMERLIYQPELLSASPSWAAWLRFQALTFAGLLVLAGFAAGALWRSPGQRLRWLALCWFFIGFLPISNLFPLNAQSAEHWIYMPSIGFILFLIALLLDAPLSWASKLIPLALLAAVPLTIRTAVRSQDWVAPAQFFTTTIQNGGGSWRANMNLAVQYLCQGDTAKAETLMRRTVAHATNYKAKITLGLVLAIAGKTSEADRLLRFSPAELPAVLMEYPNNWQACLRVAADDANAGKMPAALALLDQALAIRPDVWELFKLHTEILARAHRAEEAIAQVQAYVDTHWWHYDSHLLLAKLQTENARPTAAIATLRAAARLDVHAGEPWQKIARIQVEQNQPVLALAALDEAIARSGGLPADYLEIARVYDSLHDSAKAEAAFKKARSMGQVSAPKDLGDFL